MVAHRTCFLALALLLAACKPATPPDTAASPAAPAPDAPAAPAAPANPTAAETPPAPAAAADACVAEDFAAFLKRFSDDAAVQRAAAVDPLAMSSYDTTATPEPKLVTKQVPLAQVTFPLIFSTAEQAAQKLDVETADSGKDGKQVTVRQPDTDIQTRYEFSAVPCWKLVRVVDESL